MTEFGTELLRSLDRLAVAVEALAPAIPIDPLVAAISARFGESAFTAKDLLDESENERQAADRQGLRLPDLPHEMDMAGLSNAHAVGRYLGRLSGSVTRAGYEHGRFLWAVQVSQGDETPVPVSRRLRAG